jgi:NitT/TauT family transport system substrate-binding protein
MKSRNVLIASAVAVTMLPAGCSSGGSGGGAPQYKPEKTNIVVNAFPAIDSAGLYIAQDQGLFAAQGLHVTIVPVKNPPPSTQDLIDGQVHGQYDITAGDYVTYIEDQLGMGATKADLRIIAESSFLQPNVLTLLVKGGSPISQVSQLKGKVVSVNAPNDIGTLLIDSLLVAHGLKPGQVHYANVPFPVTAAWAKKYPNTLKAFTAALSQGQEIADTDRAAVERVLQKYLHIDKQAVAFISLPAFPLGVDAVRLQRVVSSMKRFGLLPRSTRFQVTSMIAG